MFPHPWFGLVINFTEMYETRLRKLYCSSLVQNMLALSVCKDVGMQFLQKMLVYQSLVNHLYDILEFTYSWLFSTRDVVLFRHSCHFVTQTAIGFGVVLHCNALPEDTKKCTSIKYIYYFFH